MKYFRLLLAATALFGMAGTAVEAQQIIGSTAQNAAIQSNTTSGRATVYNARQMVGGLTGDATRAEYGPDYRGNIVGGGDRVAQGLTGDATEAQYANPNTSRAPINPTSRRQEDPFYMPERN